MKRDQESGKRGRIRAERDARNLARFDKLGVTRIVQPQNEIALQPQLA